MIETDLEVIAVTAVEDSLQHGVVDTLSAIKQANITFWMLTGDKTNTAINIAYRCGLIDNSFQILNLRLEKDILDNKEIMEKDQNMK